MVNQREYRQRQIENTVINPGVHRDDTANKAIARIYRKEQRLADRANQFLSEFLRNNGGNLTGLKIRFNSGNEFSYPKK